MAKGKELAVPRVEEDWEVKLREQARNEKSSVTVGVTRLLHGGGVLTIDGKKLDKNTARVICLGVVYAKEWYKEVYTPGASDTPGCYAFARKEDPTPKQHSGLVPHAAVPDKQADQCDGCQHNAFGTARVGRGKACSDKVRMLFIMADDLQKQGDAEVNKAILKAPHYQVSVPAGSLRNFSDFLGTLAEVTPHGNIREAIFGISAEGVQNKAYALTFEFLDVVPREAMGALLKRGESAYDLLAQPFPVLAEQEEKSTKPVKGQVSRNSRR